MNGLCGGWEGVTPPCLKGLALTAIPFAYPGFVKLDVCAFVSLAIYPRKLILATKPVVRAGL